MRKFGDGAEDGAVWTWEVRRAALETGRVSSWPSQELLAPGRRAGPASGAGAPHARRLESSRAPSSRSPNFTARPYSSLGQAVGSEATEGPAGLLVRARVTELEDTTEEDSISARTASPVSFLPAGSAAAVRIRGAMRAARACGPKITMSSLKSPVSETTTAHSMPSAPQRRRRRSAARSHRRVIVAGHDEAGDARRRCEGAQATGRERGSGDGVRQRGDDGEHRLDALAHQQRAGVVVAEADGTAVDTPERLARERHVCLGGTLGIEPRPVDADDGAVSGLLAWTGVFLRAGVFPRTRVFPCVGGDGGDQCRQAAHAARRRGRRVPDESAARGSGIGGWREP